MFHIGGVTTLMKGGFQSGDCECVACIIIWFERPLPLSSDEGLKQTVLTLEKEVRCVSNKAQIKSGNIIRQGSTGRCTIRKHLLSIPEGYLYAQHSRISRGREYSHHTLQVMSCTHLRCSPNSKSNRTCPKAIPLVRREEVQLLLNKSLEQGLNLSRSQQQGYSTAYSTPFNSSRLQRIHPRPYDDCNSRTNCPSISAKTA